MTATTTAGNICLGSRFALRITSGQNSLKFTKEYAARYLSRCTERLTRKGSGLSAALASDLFVQKNLTLNTITTGVSVSNRLTSREILTQTLCCRGHHANARHFTTLRTLNFQFKDVSVEEARDGNIGKPDTTNSDGTTVNIDCNAKDDIFTQNAFTKQNNTTVNIDCNAKDDISTQNANAEPPPNFGGMIKRNRVNPLLLEDDASDIAPNNVNVGYNKILLYQGTAILVLRMAMRLKLYHFAGIFLLLSGWGIGVFDNETAKTSVFILIAMSGLMLIATPMSTAYVGRMTLDKATSKVTISTLNFWGNRIDKEYNVRDIYVSKDAYQANYGDVFFRFQTYTDDASYVISNRNWLGKVHSNKFYLIFGNDFNSSDKSMSGK